MSELEIRLGKPNAKDRQEFIQLWEKFLTEHLALGGDIEPSEHNLLEMLRVYDSYTQGSLFGFALIASQDQTLVGALIAGEMPGGFDLRSVRLGRLLWLWGVYIEPSHRQLGLAHQLQDRGAKEALLLGFTRVRSLVLRSSPAGEANALNWGAVEKAMLIERELEVSNG